MMTITVQCITTEDCNSCPLVDTARCCLAPFFAPVSDEESGGLHYANIQAQFESQGVLED